MNKHAFGCTKTKALGGPGTPGSCPACRDKVGPLLACIGDDKLRAMYIAAPDLLAACKRVAAGMRAAGITTEGMAGGESDPKVMLSVLEAAASLAGGAA